jgi:hypothetical protein
MSRRHTPGSSQSPAGQRGSSEDWSASRPDSCVRGSTWENQADKAIKDDLKAFDKMRSLSDGDKQRLKQRIEPLLETQRDFLRSDAAVEAIANRVTWHGPGVFVLCDRMILMSVYAYP